MIAAGTARTGPERRFRAAGPRLEPARGAAPCPAGSGLCPWVPGPLRGSERGLEAAAGG